MPNGTYDAVHGVFTPAGQTPPIWITDPKTGLQVPEYVRNRFSPLAVP